MEKEFLHTIDLNALQKETGLDIEGLAKLADVSTQTVYRWAWSKQKQGNRPLYNSVIRLLQAGASTETIFGVKQAPKPEAMSRQDFIDGVKEALAALGKQ